MVKQTQVDGAVGSEGHVPRAANTTEVDKSEAGRGYDDYSKGDVFQHPNRMAAMQNIFALTSKLATTREDQREIVRDLRRYIDDLELEITLLRRGVLGKWALWHDNRWRLLNLIDGLIGSVSWRAKGLMQVGYRVAWNSSTKFIYEDYYGLEEDAKQYVETKLGLRAASPAQAPALSSSEGTATQSDSTKEEV